MSDSADMNVECGQYWIYFSNFQSSEHNACMACVTQYCLIKKYIMWFEVMGSHWA